MDLRHLRYFVAVAETRNFRAAAERLYMAQPPLSQQIRALENELGAQLFVRTTRKVELTKAGEMLLLRAREALRLVDQMVLDTRRVNRAEVGHLAIGFLGSVTYEFLPLVMKEFGALHPGVELVLHGEMGTRQQAQALVSGELDVGLIRPPVEPRTLAVERIRTERFVVLLAAEHPLARRDSVKLAELCDETFVAYASSEGSAINEPTRQAFEEAGFSPMRTIEVKETGTLVSLVCSEVGVAMVPESVAYWKMSRVVAVPVDGTNASIDLAVAWDPSNASPALAQFLEVVRRVGSSYPPTPSH